MFTGKSFVFIYTGWETWEINKSSVQPIFKQYSTSIPPKTSENRRFSDVFRGYRSETLVENGLKEILNLKH